MSGTTESNLLLQLCGASKYLNVNNVLRNDVFYLLEGKKKLITFTTHNTFSNLLASIVKYVFILYGCCI